MKVRTGSSVSGWLRDRGFSPVQGSKKVAGVAGEWQSQGRKALVGYELYSRTGQSSTGLATWGYTVTTDEQCAA